MPGFGDNLKRAREAAGLSPEDLASRVGAAPLWLTHLEAIGAALPELPHLVRLADAIGCSLDQLLAGRDEEFDHPRRRHAALIAARLGRVSTLLAKVKSARASGALTSIDDAQVDEPALVNSVSRCRGWVTAPDADLAIAATLERDLDTHIARIERACERVDASARRTGRANAEPSGQPESGATVQAPAQRPTASLDVAGLPCATTAASLAPEADAAPAADSAGRGKPVADARPGPSGHRSSLWSRPSAEPDDYVCEMFTGTDGVELRLVCGPRVLAVRACRNLDEAFGQSSAWKRLADPESLLEAAPGLTPGAA